MINLTLYTRTNCHLCDETKADLASLQEKYPHRLAEIDIDSDPALIAAYGESIPVVEIGPYVLKAPIKKQDLAMTIGAAIDRQKQLEKVGDERYQKGVQRGATFSSSDKFSYWLSRRYMLLVILSLLLYVGLPILAPVLKNAGATTPANIIYKMYSPLCHQFGFRSFFLFGDQPYYPLSETGLTGEETGLLDFETATGITHLHAGNSEARFAARNYQGEEGVGYKMALCERDIAIYAAMLLFAIIFTLTGSRIPPLHWAAWVLIGLGFIGFDGFSQLISQFELPFLAEILPYRESTPFLRTFTGFLFGFSTAWFGIPYVEESMRETRQLFIKKLAIINARD
ncbi:MAG: DUF2085 domain-containing protein [Anaerolineae bacterium]|jgi:uncharacterized membrane protein|nr:DUF2085 domain-containing protein [Anaerolineae bacterium]MBT7070357.1 DUF2085 domain-containing protein [Anaerolineae bacterium]MBT7324399.1 DUF2085 domain-containing protein [Anaerolineae bacterium]